MLEILTLSQHQFSGSIDVLSNSNHGIFWLTVNIKPRVSLECDYRGVRFEESSSFTKSVTTSSGISSELFFLRCFSRQICSVVSAVSFSGSSLSTTARYLRTPARLPYLRSEKHPIPRQCLQPLPLKKSRLAQPQLRSFHPYLGHLLLALGSSKQNQFLPPGAINSAGVPLEPLQD